MKRFSLIVLLVVFFVCGCSYSKPSKLSIAKKYFDKNGISFETDVFSLDKKLFSFNGNATQNGYKFVITYPEILKDISVESSENMHSISHNGVNIKLDLLSSDQQSIIDLFCIPTAILAEKISKARIEEKSGFILLYVDGSVFKLNENYEIIEISNGVFTAKFTKFSFLE